MKHLLIILALGACAHAPQVAIKDRDGRVTVSPKPKPRPANRWVNPDGTHGIRIDDSCMGGCPPKDRYVVKP